MSVGEDACTIIFHPSFVQSHVPTSILNRIFLIVEKHSWCNEFKRIRKAKVSILFNLRISSVQRDILPLASSKFLRVGFQLLRQNTN